MLNQQAETRCPTTSKAKIINNKAGIALMKKSVVSYAEVEAYVTKDDSVIRELMHPSRHRVKNQSLAEAVVPVGVATRRHYHVLSEELYYIKAGMGRMVLGDEQFDVATGDTVCIPPGTEHCIRNTGEQDLVILCSCAPAYTHEDTVLV